MVVHGASARPVPKRVLGDERFAQHFCAVAAAPWRALQILHA